MASTGQTAHPASSPAAGTTAFPAGRLFYLDAVRAFAMLFGIFVHGTTIANPYLDDMPLFAAIQSISDLFRVAVFFLVSGFFTNLVYQRNGLTSYLRTRGEILLVPLAASMIFIVPITNWMIHSWHNGYLPMAEYFSMGRDYFSERPNGTIGNDTWALHIWFLFSLVIYAALAPLLAKIIDSDWFGTTLDAYLERTAGWTHWANVLLFAIALMLGRASYDLLFRHLADGTMWHWIVRATLRYLPMFFLGMMAFTNRRFLASLSVLSIPGLLLFSFAYWAISTLGADLPRHLERVLYWTIYGGLSMFTISAVIWFFKKYSDRPGRFLTFAVDSAYSFYLFHFTFIYLVAWFSRLFTDNFYISYLLILLLATPATLGWHALVIDKVPLLRFLFTGRRRKRIDPQKASRVM